MYWTTCTVVACEPGRSFAFTVGGRRAALITWSYELREASGGTDVTESFELADILPLRLYWSVLGWARGRRNHNDMARTLHAIKTAVET